MPLLPYKDGDIIGDTIYQDRDGSFWTVIGYIDRPMLVLQKMGTEDAVNRVHEIIGCPNADRWTPFSRVEQT